jgi:putative transposase
MVEYKQSSHSVWDIRYDVIWVTKYRYKALRGEIAVRTRDLLRQICQGREVVIVQGAASPDHVHMLVSVPPQLSPAKLAQHMSGRPSRTLQDEFPQLKKRYWGQHPWARAFLCERRRGGRGDGQAVYRESEAGGPGREFQDYRAERAVSRL